MDEERSSLQNFVRLVVAYNWHGVYDSRFLQFVTPDFETSVPKILFYNEINEFGLIHLLLYYQSWLCWNAISSFQYLASCLVSFQTILLIWDDRPICSYRDSWSFWMLRDYTTPPIGKSVTPIENVLWSNLSEITLVKIWWEMVDVFLTLGFMRFFKPIFGKRVYGEIFQWSLSSMLIMDSNRSAER